ncbi:hypothetical protein VNO78_33512 [Psophocarpus tetragonolobus]|uniref:Uncharacterized protein n=1 Tax=Psophocarpus tetragonolobus TaxID=3891 RepID=A0AAN9RPR6_PSOTE
MSPSFDLAVIDKTSLVPSRCYWSRKSHRQYHTVLGVAHHPITGTVNGTFINVNFLQDDMNPRYPHGVSC